MKYANGIFSESIHSNLPDKRNVDNPKRQEDFKERWKLTRSLKKEGGATETVKEISV